MIPSERLAQAQLDAYNAHDIDAFLACYHDEVEIFDLHTAERTMQGKSAMRERYGKMFADLPDLHVTLVQRIVCGTTAVDHERVFGLVPDEIVDVIATYQIVDDLIRRVWFAR